MPDTFGALEMLWDRFVLGGWKQYVRPLEAMMAHISTVCSISATSLHSAI